MAEPTDDIAAGNMPAFEEGRRAIVRGDIEAFLRVVDPDVVWLPQRSAMEGAYHGHDGVRKWFAQTRATFDLFEWDVREVRDLGERILAAGSVHIRGHRSSVETDIPFAGLFTFARGKVIRWEDFRDRRLALEAAGLEG
jgi:ketosteroid isomerase-like protein